MSIAEQRTWEKDLDTAGWRRESGWWVHDEVGGLHNLLRAIAILESWIQ